MSDYGITADNILSSLPSVLQKDENMYALAESIAGVLASQGDDLQSIAMYPDMDSLSEELCDILAVDFDIGWYGYDYPLSIKRNQVKSNFNIHRRLGTYGAVKQAISDIYPNSDVQEWYDYGGDPYYFRIVLDVTDQIVENIMEPDVRKAINLFKSLRSRLEDDAIIFRSRAYFELRTSTGYVLYDVRRCGTHPQRATQGEITEVPIELQTAARDVVYGAPRTGDISAGTYPYTATKGGIDDIQIELLTASENVVYGVPSTNDVEAGTYPRTATQGGASDAGYLLSVEDASGGVSYDVHFCGDGWIL